jgi:hypothetical protein
MRSSMLDWRSDMAVQAEKAWAIPLLAQLISLCEVRNYVEWRLFFPA